VVAGSKVRLGAELPGKPDEIVPAVKSTGLEGILAKRKDSTYSARTTYGLPRHATFLGLREDKEPTEVVKE
jgi:ATP-dependent DNA ligase